MTRNYGWYQLKQLFLDPKNRRHAKFRTDKQAINELLSADGGHKLYNLAKDIVKFGELSPSDVLMITKDPGQQNYVVLEGNRRVAALKVLTDPNLAIGSTDFDKFEKLSEIFQGSPIEQIYCVELPRDDADAWIEKRHHIGRDGTGLLPWNAIAQARVNADKHDKYAPWVTAEQFLRENGYDVDLIQFKLPRKTTTIDRVFGSPHIEDILGVSFLEGGKVAINGEVNFSDAKKNKAFNLIKKVFLAMLDPKFTVREVDSVRDMRKFLSGFSNLSLKGTTKKLKAKSPTRKKTKTTRSKARTVLAKDGLVIPDDDLHNFYCELTSLDVKEYTHVAFIVIRVFLERTTMLGIDKFKIPYQKDKNSRKKAWRDVKFARRIELVLNHIDPSNRDRNLKWVRIAANPKQAVFPSLEMFNIVIHETGIYPDKNEVLKSWDRLHPYFEKVFTSIVEKNKTP